jgi:iron complex transport system ATP-binding protein
MPMARLETHALAVRIADVQVCSKLDLQVREGESWCILGRNGTGKTTLLHTLAGLRAPEAGDISLNDRSLAAQPRRAVARQLGLLAQDHRDSLPASVMETALIGRHPFLGPLQWESHQDRRAARLALQAVDLQDLEDRNVATLSGGERRRLGIATLLTQDPQLLLLDEPTNHLDVHHQVHILELLQRKMKDAGKSIVMVMHDINLASRYCNRFLLLLGEGRTVQGSAAKVLTRELLEQLYAHPLEAIPGPYGTVWLPGWPTPSGGRDRQ